MAHEPLVTVETDDFSVTYVLGLEDDADTVEDADAVIRARDGKGWTASFMTPRKIADLVIVREPGPDAMTRALVDLFGEYGMDTNVLPRFDADEEEEEDQAEDG
ncbi:hypothetical protein ACGF5O_46140 [Streptomyces sp. NPDC048291]|uniref:hypothetical protein n=1 Tax=Streptomyces sp. NPDC048291 TaxID=3365530 RepID=UPI00371C03DB